jgi:hypothetical protein
MTDQLTGSRRALEINLTDEQLALFPDFAGERNNE